MAAITSYIEKIAGSLLSKTTNIKNEKEIKKRKCPHSINDFYSIYYNQYKYNK